jgi:hypothetical protein
MKKVKPYYGRLVRTCDNDAMSDVLIQVGFIIERKWDATSKNEASIIKKNEKMNHMAYTSI